MEKTIQLPWSVPFGEFSLKVDPLSLLFLAAISILVLCAGVYGVGYLRHNKGKKPLGLHLFFYLLLTLALVLIVLANNVILFLGAWECMAVSTYFLIVFHDEKASARRAGLLYLVMSHCGTFCLFLMFFLMARSAGSMSFDGMAHASFSPLAAGVIFCLALIGFGVKAGFLPMHVWLPHAHPEAPSHVSALLSGIAIKTGIYGICRVIWTVGVLPDWCAYVLLAIGISSGVMGVLYAIGQHELKRLLAYHSIENIGIIVLGLGAGLLGRNHDMPFLAVLGFGGGLLHVLNHSLFKGLLFLGAGAVIQQTGTGQIDHMGGVAKRMPLTSILFLVGALAICGLPLFNGFISEFFIYFGLFQGLFGLPLVGAVSCAAAILALGLMGALALACFAKVYGSVFLGEPRRPECVRPAVEPSRLMTGPMLVLAGLCVWIGVAPQTAARLTFAGGECLVRVRPGSFESARVLEPLSFAIFGVCLFVTLVGVLLLIRRKLPGPVAGPAPETWGCGFAQVSARCQYTASSFAQPVVDFMQNVLVFRRHCGDLKAAFPGKAHMHSSVHDASEEGLLKPLYRWLNTLSRAIDNGRIRFTQIYLFYIFLYLIFLLVWKLR